MTGIGTKLDDCQTGDIRLIGGTVSNDGRLEICINNHWGGICSLNWDSKDTQVTCKQLGYQEQGMLGYSEWVGGGYGRITQNCMAV